MKKIVTLGAAIALTTSLAFAQGYGPGMMGGGGYGLGMMGGPMAASLKLTDEQEDRLFALHEQMRTKNFGTMGKLHSEQFKLRKLMKAENVDSKAVLEQQKKVDEVRREMFAAHLEMRKQVEAILTPHQRKQFRQFGPWHEGE